MAVSAPRDYSALSMNVTFSAEVSERTVTIQTMEDAILERTAKSFFVHLIAPADQFGLVLGQDTATITITDDDSRFCNNIYHVSVH